MKSFSQIVNLSIIITSFVFTMMLLVEYLNVITHGKWQNKLRKSKFGQIILGVLLGAVPGCLGAFTVVSLYSHGVVSFGALVATMIATSGDEAYVMLSLFPVKAILLMVIISVIGFLVGYLTDRFYKKEVLLLGNDLHEFELHSEDTYRSLSLSLIKKQLVNITFPRALLIGMLVVFLALLATNSVAAHEENWIRISLAITTFFGLYVVATVPDHFLEKHLWQHVLKKHLLRIFLWTFGTLLFLYYMQSLLDIDAWIHSNYIIVLLIAVLIGIIPESGPHLIFVTLFASGTIPFSILLASSIVQDGHGTLPLLAISQKSFVILKAINVVTGLVVGIAGILLHF